MEYIQENRLELYITILLGLDSYRYSYKSHENGLQLKTYTYICYKVKSFVKTYIYFTVKSFVKTYIYYTFKSFVKTYTYIYYTVKSLKEASSLFKVGFLKYIFKDSDTRSNVLLSDWSKMLKLSKDSPGLQETKWSLIED